MQPTGPRKYKRRRKLNGDSDNSDFVTVEMNNQRNQKPVKQEPKAVISKKNVLAPAFLVPEDTSEFQLPDEIFQAVGKRVPVIEVKKPFSRASTSAARPKMIYTQKTRISVADGKRKTRTMIQKQVVQAKAKPQATKVSRNKKKGPFEHDESSETWSNDDPNEDVLDTLMKRERKLSEKFTMDLVNDLQDILRSPLKISDDKNFSNGEDDEHLDTSARRSRRQIMSRYGTSTFRKLGKKDRESTSEDEEMEQMVIKQEVFDEGLLCGICGDSFTSKAGLRNHISIHI